MASVGPDIRQMLLVDMEFLFLYSAQALTCLLHDVLSWTVAEKFHISSVYVHVLFYMYLLTFFPYCVSYLGNMPTGPASI